ncbi:MAG TPA: DUF1080 domain-containing protein [Chloroflexota bacterium]|nr:DUF1080 domain-containing protein [Chloroflexota bacterium]
MHNGLRYVAVGVILASLTLTLRIAQAADADKASEAAVSLFNGKDLTNWAGDPKVWSVEDGVITGQTTKESPIRANTFLIWKGGTVKDFELRLRLRLTNGNTGIQYRSKDKGNFVVNGYQRDYDDSKQWLASLYEEGGRGILASMGQKVTITPDGKLTVTGSTVDPKTVRSATEANQWVDYLIIAQGNHLVHKLNGTTIVDVIDEQESKRAMEGILALQVHAGPPMKVQFKDSYLKVLSE